MSTISLPCYGCVSTEPNYLETFENLPIQHHKTSTLNFNLKLYVRFEKRCSCGHTITDMFNIPSLLSSHYISCDEFFQIGSSFLRRNLLFHDLLTDELLDDLIPSIMSSAQKLFHNSRPHGASEFEHGFVFPLAIGVIIELPMDIDMEGVAETVVSNYMHEIKMNPASEEVVQSLNKSKLREDSDAQFCICLEDFYKSEEVSTMPCNHIFHHDCIVQWLRRSHLCPLCRHRMSTI